MKTAKNFFIALVFVVYSCSTQVTGPLTMVDVKGGKMAYFNLNELGTDIATIPVSSLMEDCLIVQLESAEDAYVGFGTVTVTEKYIGVMQFRAPYKLFDRSGKFLRSIGAIGRGPGEWNTIGGGLYDVIIDDENELIYFSLFVGNNILVYSTSGDFVKNLVTPHDIQKPKMFLSDNILTVVHIPVPENRAIAFQFDVDTGEVLNELKAPAHLIVPGLRCELLSARNVHGVFDLHFTCNDTLYHFDVKNNRLLPAFSMSYSTNEKIEKKFYQLNKNIFLADVLTFNPNLGSNGVFMGGVPVATDIASQKMSRIIVTNDFWGGITLSITAAIHNGYFALNVEPEMLMEMIDRRLEEDSCSASDREILLKTRSTLKKGANNVVFVGKLKSEVKKELW